MEEPLRERGHQSHRWRKNRLAVGVLLLVLCFIAPVFLFFYQFGASKAQLVGRYEGKYAFGFVTLVLHKGETFEQTTTLSNGITLNASGTWEVVGNEIKLNGAHGITQYGPMDLKHPNQSWSLLVHRTIGGIRLVIDEDQDLFFEKK